MIYVDDLLIMAERDEDLVEIKKCLSETFEVKDLGVAKHFLGMDIEYGSNDEIKIHQGKFIHGLLEEYKKLGLYTPR